MNNLDKQYTDLLQDILDNGVVKGDRTGTGTLSVFGRQIRHKMSEGFPLLTTKKMPWKVIVAELLWFIKGDTNIKYLVDNGCNIWNGDAFNAFLHNPQKTSVHSSEAGQLVICPTVESFAEMIKTDDEFAKKWGDLGPIYGAQWRDWNGHDGTKIEVFEPENDGLMYERQIPHHYDGVDQISNLIKDLKENPDSRRLMVNAWNVGELDKMTLPPCHYGFQCYTRELSYLERLTLLEKKYDKLGKSKLGLNHDRIEQQIDFEQIPKREISLMWNQRSVDTFLGLPFNIASYGLLLEMLAKEVNMVPGELIGNLGDTHLYLNHIEQAKEQIGRELTDDEYTQALKDADLETFNKIVEVKKLKSELIKTQKYQLASEYKMKENELIKKMPYVPFITREPYPLPTLDELPDFECYNPNDFKLIGYKSHPTIKAPLSN